MERKEHEERTKIYTEFQEHITLRPSRRGALRRTPGAKEVSADLRPWWRVSNGPPLLGNFSVQVGRPDHAREHEHEAKISAKHLNQSANL